MKEYLATWQNIGSAKFTQDKKDEIGNFTVTANNYNSAMIKAREKVRDIQFLDTKIISLRRI